ncbi:hypothetical protein, partial [Tritonibacter sp. SIMBA_163]|uniref:hypothetical protein n=1 Tax=Tritonibacter sp. SIMBA_163 TaxID=3080868 RepID=UPI003980F959
CLFSDNENGILSGRVPGSHMTIEHSEFSENGYGDGQSHNLYAGNIDRLTLRFNHFRGAVVGHQIKSRALHNEILYNHVSDDTFGRSSYLVD